MQAGHGQVTRLADRRRGAPAGEGQPLQTTVTGPRWSAASRADSGSLAVAIAGLAPGFLLPFVLAVVLSASDSDALLLAVSVAMTLTTVLGSAIELHTIGEVGRLAVRDGVGAGAYRTYERKVRTFAFCTAAVLTPLLFLLYSSRYTGPSPIAVLVLPLSVSPLLGAVSSTLSGRLIVAGSPNQAVATQGLRSLPPLVALSLASVLPLPLPVLACAWPAGEALRLVVLRLLLRPQHEQAGHSSPTMTGLGLQSLSSATSQANPLLDRTFLAGAPSGSVTAYELADKIFFAGSQLVAQGLLVRRVAHWSMFGADPDPGHDSTAVKRDIALVTRASCALAVLVAVGCWMCRQSGLLPGSYDTGLLWGGLAVASLPLATYSYAVGRVLVLAQKQSLLLLLAVLSVVSNAALNLCFYVWMGGIGVVVATVATRCVSALASAICLRRELPVWLAATRAAPLEGVPCGA